MATPNLSVMATVAIDSRTKEIADNVSNNNAVLWAIKKHGGIKPFTGGTSIVEEFSFAENTNAGSYSGFDTLTQAQTEELTAASYAIKQYQVAVTISGLEEAMNSGKEKMIDLLDSKLEVAEASLTNKLVQGLYSDGTGNSGKDLTGLQAAIPVSNATGTYGNINRATWSIWRNKKRKGGAVDFTGTITSANVWDEYMALYLQLVRGTDKPTVAVASTSHYLALMKYLQAQQRFNEGSVEMAKAGFQNIMFMETPVVVENNTGASASGMPAATTYFLNTKHLRLRPFGGVDFKSFGKDPVSQDAMIKHMKWYGNLTCRNQFLQGVIQD
jgi:hypothetical protein